MKQIVIAVVFLFACISLNAQSFNIPRTSHHQISCRQNLYDSSCNLIANPTFRFTSDSVEAFSEGNVSLWQDINTMTSDIKGALATNLSCSLLALPSILGGGGKFRLYAG